MRAIRLPARKRAAWSKTCKAVAKIGKNQICSTTGLDQDDGIVIGRTIRPVSGKGKPD
jgi:hypothetical protein